MRIVGHHDDGLAMVAIEDAQEFEDLIAGLPIEVAGRLVTEQEHRIAHDRPRDPDALFLAAGQLTRIVFGTIGQTHERERGLHVALPFPARQLRQQQWQFGIALRCEHRQEVVELKDEADMISPPAGGRARDI